MRYTEEQIAQACHEVNRAFCVAIGDVSQPPWNAAPQWQRNSALDGVRKHLDGSICTPEQSHESWLEHKRKEGWKFGPVKDTEKREHPCCVPYAELPPEQRAKDALFAAVVAGMRSG